MPASRDPVRHKERALLAVQSRGGACLWKDAPSLPAGDLRRAVDALCAEGLLREVWCQPARGGNPSHWLLLPDFPEERLPGRVVPRRPAPSSPPSPQASGGSPCPWCRSGRITLHGPEEPWVVTEDLAEDPDERFMAGIKRSTFTAAPVEWFSCSSCEMTGTFAYLAVVLANVRTRGCPGAP